RVWRDRSGVPRARPARDRAAPARAGSQAVDLPFSGPRLPVDRRPRQRDSGRAGV
ncbi:uncharacterized protein METZ01_LOCUS467799, partial [marine metagenome]